MEATASGEVLRRHIHLVEEGVGLVALHFAAVEVLVTEKIIADFFFTRSRRQIAHHSISLELLSSESCK